MIIIKSDIVSLHGAAISMTGGRPENQDDMAYSDTPLGFLIVVCDGMGGGPGGKTASYIVKQEIIETLFECNQQTPRDHALKMAAARAHQALEVKMAENPALNGMGSTFVAVLINSQSAVIAHAGDSRCYRIHGKKCLFRSQDHSLVAELVRKKVMTEEEARHSPQANVITRGLGSTNNHIPEIEEIPYKKGDRFILCTDGVWGVFEHHELLRLFAQPVEQQKLLSDLSVQIDKIGFSKGGGHDNHTIAMFELENNSQLEESSFRKKWIQISFVALLATCLIGISLYIVLHLSEQKGYPTSQTVVPVQEGVPSPNDSPSYETSSTKENLEIEDNKKPDTKVCDNVEDNTSNAGGNADNGIVSNDCNSNQINKDLRNRLLERMGRANKDSDSIIRQQSLRNVKNVAPKPIETVQKIINRYNSAKAVGKKTIGEAQKSIEAKKAEIKVLFVNLSEQTKHSNAHQSVVAINRFVDDPASWYINKEPDKKSKMFMLTPKSKSLVDEQVNRLRKLKESLEKETE